MKVASPRIAPTPRRLVEAAGRLASLAAMALVSGQALAQGPTGGQLVHGTGSIAQNGSSTVITAGNGAIFNFQNFSIGSGHSVQFIQPSSTSRVLNRVTGPDPSVIAGRLTSNGIVYIANPAGVFFANGALVNVGGIYAAAGKISTGDFLSGNNRFTNLTGVVENRGTINGQTVGLIGARAANYGVVNAPAGMVTMAAGGEVYIGEQHGQIYARVRGGSGETGVTQAGQVNAEGGQVRLGAGDMYAMAIDHPGSTRARSITLEGGEKGVVSVSGRLDASDRSAGGVGGTVSVLGDRVGVFGGQIDVSGDAGGGTALVGGNWQGKGRERNASAAYVSEDASINADAVRNGNGGTVVVWSDNVTRVFGDISARGGEGGGRGGMVETSGKNELQVTRTPDVTASRGLGGLWLIDPHNVTIVAGSGNTNIPGTSPFEATGDDAQLGVDLILAALMGGASVSVTTGTTGTQDGDITLATALDFNGTGTNTLTLDAARDIILNGAISDSVAGGDELDLVLNAGRDIRANETISLGGGDLTFNGAAFLNSAAAIEGGAVTFTGPVVLETHTVVTGAASVSFGSTIDSEATEANSLVVNSPVTTFGGDIGATAANTALGQLQTDAAGTTTINSSLVNADIVNFEDAVVVGADLSVTAGTSAEFDGTVDSEAGEGNDLIVNAPTTVFGGDVGAGTGGALGLLRTDLAGATGIGGAVTADTVEFNDGVVISADSVVTAATSATFGSTIDSASVTARSLTINSPVTVIGGDVGVGAGLNLFKTDAAGTTTINTGEIQARRIDFGDAVVLGQDATMGGTVSVVFRSTVNSEAGEANDLTLNSPVTNFNGQVGNAAGNTALGAITTDAAGTTTINTAVVKAATVDFGDAVELAFNLTLTATDSATFRGAVDSRDAQTRSLTVNSPLTTFGGVVGGATGGTLGTLTTDAAGTTLIDAGAVSAQTIAFNDAVELRTGLVVTASNTVTFGSTLDSQTGEANDLTINAPQTTFAGAVGATGALGTLATDELGFTTIGGGSIEAASILLEDDVVLNQDTALTATTRIRLGSTVDSQSGEGNDLTLNSANTEVLGVVGGVTGGALGALVTDAAGSTTLGGAVTAATVTFNDGLSFGGGSITTTGDQVYGGPVTISANTTLQGANVTFNGTLDSSGADRTMTINTVGNGITRFNAAVGGGVTPLASLTTNVDGQTIIAGGEVTTSGDQTYQDTLVLGANATLTARNFLFNGTVDSDGTARSLSTRTTLGGTTTFGRAVGGTSVLSSLTVGSDGTTNFDGGTATATGSIVFNNAVVLGADTVLDGQSVAFGGTLNSDENTRNLVVLTHGGGDTSFSGAVGATSPLRSIATNVDGRTLLFGGSVRTTGNQDFHDAVVLGANTVVTGANIAFYNTIDSTDLLVPASLTVNTTGSGITTFRGEIGGSNPLASLTTDANGTTRIGSDITTLGAGMSFGDNVRFFGDSTLTDTGNTGIAFAGTINSEGSARRVALLTNTGGTATASSPSLARILFGGSVGQTLALQSLTLGGNRASVPTVATIFAGLDSQGNPIANYALAISTVEAFTMGVRQKFSVAGDLTINAGSATLGDISTLRNMTVNAPSIVINTRPGAPVLQRSGASLVTAGDLGTDFVAGGRIEFSSVPTLAGGFSAPNFATPEGVNISSTLSGFPAQSYGSVAANELHLGSNGLDLRAQGPTGTNVATAIAGALPTQEQSGLIIDDTGVGRAQADELALLGITARSREQRELIDFLAGGAIYYDVPPALGASDVPVTVNRLPAPIVSETLEAYRAVFYRDGVRDAERPRRVLTEAWRAYSAAAGDKADALGFRAYAEAVPAQAEAVYYLDSLRELFGQLGSLGLSPGELRVAKDTILRAVSVPGMSKEELEAAIVATNLGAAE